MKTDERVEHDLASLRRWAERLRRIAAVWDDADFDPIERQAFVLEWDNIIDRLEDVEALSVRGVLRPPTEAELRRVADELAELIPTMQRLNLRQPDPEALQRARAVEAA